MNVRKILASTAAAAMIAGVITIASAPAASAANLDVTVNCDADVWIGTPAVGDTLTLTLGEGCTTEWNLHNISQLLDNGFVPGYLATANVAGDPAWAVTFSDFTRGRWRVSPTGTGTASLVTTILAVDDEGFGVPASQGSQLAELDTDNYSSVFSIRYGTAPVASGSASPIPSWVQGYGRANADEACLEGWDASWAQWMNDSTGGFVCQRSVPSAG